jgi:hypothetical protein
MQIHGAALPEDSHTLSQIERIWRCHMSGRYRARRERLAVELEGEVTASRTPGARFLAASRAGDSTAKWGLL